MSRYSLDDTCAHATDMDTLPAEDTALDAFARDCDTFDRDTCADSLDEYVVALFAEADTRTLASDERATARACMRAHENVERDARVLAHARDAFERYVSRFTRDGYAPGVTRFS